MSSDPFQHLDKRRTMPKQKPGKSKQDYGTPIDLGRAAAKRFGKFVIDLAATEENKKVERFISPEQDSFKFVWADLVGECENAWLNPPYSNIAPWAEKCRVEGEAFAKKGARICFLTPASVGSNWFINSVHGHALVLALAPRLVFEGETQPYPKDCIVSVFGDITPGFEPWRWTS